MITRRPSENRFVQQRIYQVTYYFLFTAVGLQTNGNEIQKKKSYRKCVT